MALRGMQKHPGGSRLEQGVRKTLGLAQIAPRMQGKNLSSGAQAPPGSTIDFSEMIGVGWSERSVMSVSSVDMD